MDELVEKAAKAIAAYEWEWDAYPSLSQHERDIYLGAARAVIPIVLETAAQKADAYAEIWEAPSLTIATAIRALASRDKS